jgi:hypothetical protein
MASCYFWKWADNDLPGKPMEVHAALLRGDRHPALQAFDARPISAAIEALANDAAPEERDQWEWIVEPARQEHEAIFILLNRPSPVERKSMHHQLARQLLPHDVTCFNETLGMLEDCFPPKLNKFKAGQWPGEVLYDLTPADLPVLIKRLRPKSPDPFAILNNRQTHFVQCYRDPEGFCVEWRENDIRDCRKFQQWRAQDRKRLETLNVPYTRHGIPPGEDPDLLSFADTLRIFEAFVRAESRPSRNHWMNINHWLE